MVNCVFQEAGSRFQCINCGSVKRKKTKRNCGLRKGLGDGVARITKAVGIKPCGGCNKRRSKLNKMKPTPAFESARLVSTSELVQDALQLCRQIPAKIDGICGIPRSGMIPAATIAAMMHLPLYTYQHGVARYIGNGHRFQPAEQPQNMLFVDDTCMNGNTVKKLAGSVTGYTAAIYCNPHATDKRDYWVKDLEPPHLLEWNLFNSGFIPQMAFDMDGVLCYDQTPDQWDPTTAQVRYMARKQPITIITARMEKDRGSTQRWLYRHGVNVEKLIMFPGTDSDRMKPQAVSKYKAEQLQRIKRDWFVESCRIQAQEIAEFSGAWVICTEDGQVY